MGLSLTLGLALVAGLVGAPSAASAQPRATAASSQVAADTTDRPTAGVFQFIGVYHGAEAPATDGERWLGLYATDTGWELAPVTIHTQIAYDPILDDADGPFTGIEVRTDRSVRDGDVLSDAGLAFFRSDRLSAGPVRTSFAGSWFAQGDAHLSISTTAGGLASLASVPVADRPGGTLLTLDGTPLIEHSDFDDGFLQLMWAGDLDRDGVLDLLLDAPPHYNMTKLQLWLSSTAAGDAPLGLTAEHVSTGC